MFNIRETLPLTLMQGGQQILFLCDSRNCSSEINTTNVIVNATNTVPSTGRRAEELYVIVPMKLGSAKHSFPYLRCVCQYKAPQQQTYGAPAPEPKSGSELNILGRFEEYEEVYRLCNFDYDNQCIHAKACSNKLKQIAGCVVKPNMAVSGDKDNPTCVALTPQDCRRMHNLQMGANDTKVCVNNTKSFATMCEAVSSANPERLAATAVVRKVDKHGKNVPCPVPVNAAEGEPMFWRHSIYTQSEADGEFCNYTARRNWTHMHHLRTLMVHLYKSVSFCFICEETDKNVTVWYSEDSLSETACIRDPGGHFPYAQYTITFASASNGFVGFSNALRTVYTEVAYIVLPPCDLKMKQNDDDVSCQISLQVGFEGLWPSNINSHYEFLLNGRTQGTIKSQKEHAIVNLEKIQEAGTYECRCHMYYCGPYSSENYLGHVSATYTVTETLKMKAERESTLYIWILVLMIAFILVSIGGFYLYRLHVSRQSLKKLKFLTGTPVEERLSGRENLRELAGTSKRKVSTSAGGPPLRNTSSSMKKSSKK